ncbi:MAG: MBL fold metallo-hydrolase [bacterium]|nr:MAG: MBL fold metallo-hydrolase [bacterium]
MKGLILLSPVLLLLAASAAPAAEAFETDTFATSEGDLVITFIGHGTLMFTFGGKVVHVDPYSSLADYQRLPDADVILITHEHRDHLDPKALDPIRKKSTVILANPASAARIEGARSLENGQKTEVLGLKVEAVPAYNVVHKRDGGEPFHPRGRDNGYIVTFADKRVYIAGDTENIMEMKGLDAIDIAFIPANLPYTMTPEMAADAAMMIRPAFLYPYHYGETDVGRIAELLAKETDIQVRVRRMK